MAHTFTSANFESEVINSKNLVLVDFWAPWCGPCRMLGPIIDELAVEMEKHGIKVGKMNVDENVTVAAQFGIMSMPTLIIFKDGAAVDQMVGMQSKDALSARLLKLIAA